jgi:hypothetical protein
MSKLKESERLIFGGAGGLSTSRDRGFVAIMVSATWNVSVGNLEKCDSVIAGVWLERQETNVGRITESVVDGGGGEGNYGYGIGRWIGRPEDVKLNVAVFVGIIAEDGKGAVA